MTNCLDVTPDEHDGLCEPYGLHNCLVMVASPSMNFFDVHDCVEDNCTWELGTPEFDGAVNALKDCMDEWIR